MPASKCSQQGVISLQCAVSCFVYVAKGQRSRLYYTLVTMVTRNAYVYEACEGPWPLTQPAQHARHGVLRNVQSAYWLHSMTPTSTRVGQVGVGVDASVVECGLCWPVSCVTLYTYTSAVYTRGWFVVVVYRVKTWFFWGRRLRKVRSSSNASVNYSATVSCLPGRSSNAKTCGMSTSVFESVFIFREFVGRFCHSHVSYYHPTFVLSSPHHCLTWLFICSHPLSYTFIVIIT